MRTHHLLSAALVIGSIVGTPIAASAGGWNCGRCEPAYYGSSSVFYAPPTYTYAQPTVTIVPRIIVQPNYVVERTYVARPSEYLRDTRGCWSGCGDGFRIVNQGQYPAFGGGSAYYEPYWTEHHPGPYVTRYPAIHRSYYGTPRRYGYMHARRAAVWSHHRSQQTPPWPNHYRSR